MWPMFIIDNGFSMVLRVQIAVNLCVSVAMEEGHRSKQDGDADVVTYFKNQSLAVYHNNENVTAKVFQSEGTYLNYRVFNGMPDLMDACLKVQQYYNERGE